MTVHNYRSRQVHETLNGVNPSSGFRDMRSAKSGPNLWQIWQVFGPWASPCGANGQMSITVHNYRPRQFHRTSNGENPSSGYRDMGSASLAAAHPTARPPGPWRQYPSNPEGWGVKITENWLNTAVFGHMEHYNRSNVAPTESHKMSAHNIFLLQPLEHQQICKSTGKTGYRRSAYTPYSGVIACFEWCTEPYQ